MVLKELRRRIRENQRLQVTALRIAMKWVVQPRLARLGVPIIAVTGTNGKTTTVRLLVRILRRAGYHVGACSTEGVTHDETIVTTYDEAWGRGAWRAAKCPKVDVLVLETARRGLKLVGPGFRKCHVGIVTNLYEDHLGFDGIRTMEEMAEVKSAVPRAVRRDGTLVLNGDDPRVRAMAGKSRARPFYFVMEEDHRKYDSVFFVKNGSLWKKHGADEVPVIPVDDVWITSKGLQPYNVANVMAVLAAVEGMKRFLPIDASAVNGALRDFGRDPHDNLGRCHMLTLEGERFLSLYAKNPESFRIEIEIVKRVKEREGFEHVVGVISGPGNRLPAYFQDISRLVASVCDRVAVRPPRDIYLRGRGPEEIVRLLSVCIPEAKILKERDRTVSELIALSKKELGGRILFVLFAALFESGTALEELLARAEAHHPLGG